MGEIVKTSIVEESAAKSVVVNRDRVVVLAVHLVNRSSHIDVVAAKDLSLKIVAVVRVVVRLDKADIDLLNGVSEIEHTALELGQFVVPDVIPNVHHSNAVQESGDELVPHRTVVQDVLRNVLDVAGVGGRDTALVLHRGVVANGIKNRNVIRVLNLAVVFLSHYFSSFSSLVEMRSSKVTPS